MDDDYLIECIENEIESGFFDFKDEIYDFKILKKKEAFLTDVLSFANGHSKGDKYIITGVKLNSDGSRNLNGVDVSKIQDGADYQSLLNDNVEPNLTLDFKPVDYNNLKFGVFKIGKENTDRPYMLSKKYGDLNKGFMKIRRGQKNEFVTRRDLEQMFKSKIKEEKSDIFLRGVVDKKASDHFEIKKIEKPIDIDAEEVKKRIRNLFKKISEIHLPRVSKMFVDFYTPVEIYDETKKTITEFAKVNAIEMLDDFFYLGALTQSDLGLSRGLHGDEEEEKKYHLIYRLEEYILEYYGVLDIYKKLGNIYYSELCIENLGDKYDNDVEILLKVKEKDFVNFNDFPTPKEGIIKYITSHDFLDEWILNSRNSEVNLYKAEKVGLPPSYPQAFHDMLTTVEPEPKEYIDYYKEYIDYLIGYEITYETGYYYIRFSYSQIKPKEKIFLPTRLFFYGDIEYLEYRINSKFNSEIKTGRIEVLKSNI